MARKEDLDVKDIMDKYGKKLSHQIDSYEEMIPTNEAFSKEYEIFRKEALGRIVSNYENLAQWAGRTLKVAIKPQDKEKMQEAIDTAQINIAPDDSASLAAIVTIAFIFLAIIIGVASFLITVRSFCPCLTSSSMR